MISYKPFYQTLKRRGVTEYYLIHKCNISANTLYRMKHGEAISTATIDKFCKLLNCGTSDIISHVPDE